ncbi:MAG: hypothetical protein PWP65_68 [Clostridia bacterium]|nr:hypothetical protein [Clostridia bacterium]
MKEEVKDVESIGQKIRILRQRLGLTQEELGERTNLHYSYIGQLERGDKTPSLKTLRKIASALNVSPEYLFETRSGYEIEDQPEWWLQEIKSLLANRPQEDAVFVLELVRAVLKWCDNYKKKRS